MLGKFPVIFISFKDCRQSNGQNIYDSFRHLIAGEYERHHYLCDGPYLSANEKAIFERITSLAATEVEYHQALLYLSRFLERYHQEK